MIDQRARFLAGVQIEMTADGGRWLYVTYNDQVDGALGKQLSQK